MVKIVLEENQSGYDAVLEYIERFLDKEELMGVVAFTIATSYDDDDKDYIKSKHTEIVDVDYDKVVWDNDWWEGEKYIKIFGIALLNDLEIKGGIYYEKN